MFFKIFYVYLGIYTVGSCADGFCVRSLAVRVHNFVTLSEFQDFSYFSFFNDFIALLLFLLII